MEPSTINAIIAGSVGLIAGVIGSLIAPWVQWGIAKKQIKHERRIKLIQRWREIISAEEFDRGVLLNDPEYGPLRDLLTEEVRKELERPVGEITVNFGSPIESLDRDLILKEVTRIEKLWDLI